MIGVGNFIPCSHILTNMALFFNTLVFILIKKNGHTEWKHCHVTEMGLYLFVHASLPFWWDAMQTTIFLINHLPIPIFNQSFPFFLLYEGSPNYSFFRTFDCACFSHLRFYHHTKFQYHTTKCIFLGYNLDYHGSKCLHPSRKIFVACSMTYNELEFPYSSIF